MTAREFLSSHKVEFEYKDITQDPEALEELVGTYDSRATPTIVISDEVVIGFDRQRLEQLLRLTYNGQMNCGP